MRTVYFDNYYNVLVGNFLNSTDNVTRNSSIKDFFAEVLKLKLFNVLKYTLQYEFENSEHTYLDFEQQLLDDSFCSKLYSKYAEAKRLIDTIISLHKEYYILFSNYVNENNLENIKINSTTFDLNDFHNGGKFNIRYTHEGKKYIAKYRTSENDKFFNKFVDFLDSHQYKHKFGKVDVINYNNNFSIYEWVEEEGNQDYESLYFEMGQAVALANLLGSTDMHYDNVKIINNKLYFLDLETLFSGELDLEKTNPAISLNLFNNYKKF